MLSPRWIISHVFVACLVAAFIAAGLWQVDRLGERKDQNELVQQRIDAPPASLQEVGSLPVDEQEYRQVSVSGTFDTTRQILIGNRSDEGSPGFWIWTVLEVKDGGELLVNRGFVGRGTVLGLDDSIDLALADPPASAVQVTGLVRLGRVEGKISSDGLRLSRPDAAQANERLAVSGDLASNGYVDLATQTPAQFDIPTPVPSPDLGEGPHLAYAVQWFVFSVIGVFGYGAALRRIRRGDETKGDIGLEAEAPHAV